MSAKIEALNPLLRDDPERTKRWSYLKVESIQKDDKDFMGKQKRIITEAMLDNMQRWMSLQSLHETTTTSGVGAFTTYAFPLVRRVYPRLIATELFTVQPMSQPTGKVFFLDFLYGTATGSTNVGDRIDLSANFNQNYANSVEAGAVKELDLEVTSDDITATQKKIKSKWTIESQQDLMAYHGLDAESELMAAGSDEIIREIDRTLINAAVTGATAGNVNWNPTPSGYAGWDYQQREYYDKTLYPALVQANNMIYKKRYRNATWIVAGVDFCERMESLQGFQLMDQSDALWQVQHGGRQLYGTLKNRWLVYKDPWFDNDKALLGYRGVSFLDAGFVYAPYIPLYVTPTLTDPDDFTPRRGLMSRFGYRMVVGDMFATVTITTS